jgi:hypothetical protein
MADNLLDWNQMIIIFEDKRSGMEIWKDTSVVFREFSAREKRATAERSYARKQCKILNGMMEGMGEETMDFRFGQLERGQGYIDPLAASPPEMLETSLLSESGS